MLNRWRSLLLFIPLCGLSIPARASNVAVTAGGGVTQSTPGNPQSGYANGTVSGSIDASDAWSIDLSVSGTHDRSSPPPDNQSFGSSGGNILSLSAGPTWMPNDNWMFDLTGTFSPKSTTFSDTSLQLDTARGATATDAQLKSINNSWGLLLGGSYDTDGDSNLEHSVMAGLGLNHLSSTESIAQTRNAKTDKPVNLNMAEANLCPAGKKSPLCRQLAALTKAEGDAFDQFSLNASYTATIFDRTDVDLGGTYYLYDADPTQVGYYSVATVGRGGVRNAGATRGNRAERGGAEFNFGGGAPLEPLIFSVLGGVSHAFGEEKQFKVAVNGGYGDYYGVDGYNLNLAVKLQYKFNKHWKATLVVAGNRDTDDQGNVTPSGSVSLGAKYTF